MTTLAASDEASSAHPVVEDDVGRLALRVRRVPGLPMVSLRVLLRAGVVAESIPGLSLTTGRLLGEGTNRRDWRRLAIDVENRGMYLNAFGTAETLGVSLDALSWDGELALDWLAEMALEPAFDEGRVRFVTRQIGAELASLLDQPDVRTARAFLEQLYRPHPLSRPMQGSEDSLASITPDECVALHRDALAWGGCVTVAGEVDEDEILETLTERFASVVATHGTGRAWPEAPAIEGLAQGRQEVEAGEADQCHLYLGHLTIPRRHPDLLALEAAGIVLGSGGDLAGRIPHRVREAEGLAYHAGVGTVSGAGLAPGRFQVYVGTGPKRVEQAERAVREELHRFVEQGLAPGELEEARAYLLGREPFRRETLRQWADAMAVAELYGIPIDRPGWREERLKALTEGEVMAAVRRWIRPGDLRVTVGMPR